jgi:predicted RNA-binding Zn ribbon-like protein
MIVPADLPPPAPGAERHVALDLANSRLALPGGGHVDLLADPAAATAWLTGRDLAPPGTVLHEICAGRLRDLRTQVRSLLAGQVTGAPPDQTALRAVNAALSLAPSTEVLRWTPARGLHRAPAHPADQAVEHALAVLAADAADLLTGPSAERLAACGSPPCRRYLVRTHASRHWCSVRCGDRARAARAYARRQEKARPGPELPPRPGLPI